MNTDHIIQVPKEAFKGLGFLNLCKKYFTLFDLLTLYIPPTSSRKWNTTRKYRKVLQSLFSSGSCTAESGAAYQSTTAGFQTIRLCITLSKGNVSNISACQVDLIRMLFIVQ